MSAKDGTYSWIFRRFFELICVTSLLLAGCSDDAADGEAPEAAEDGGGTAGDAGSLPAVEEDAAAETDSGTAGDAGSPPAVEEDAAAETDSGTAGDAGPPTAVEEEIIGMLEGTWLAKNTPESAFELFQIYHFAGQPLRATLDWKPNPEAGWCRLEPSEFDSLKIQEVDTNNSFKIVFSTNTDANCGVNPDNEGGINVMDLEAKTAEIVTTIGIIVPATFEKCSDDYYAEDACGTQSDIGPPPDPAL